MRFLNARRVWRDRSSDRGGAAMLTAVVLGAGVLMGAGALAVDVGQLHAEREQLQTGADAAVMAVAQECLSEGGCGDYAGDATQWAGLNANDKMSDAQVCWGLPEGSEEADITDNPFEGAGIEECGDSVGNLTDCIPVAGVADRPYLEVRTTSRLDGDTTLLPPVFASALESGGDGNVVGACARASYGSPRVANGLAAIFCISDYNEMTHDGNDLPSTEQAIVFRTQKKGKTAPDAGDCTQETTQMPAGGFGWLDDPTETCTAEVDADTGATGGNSGKDASIPCEVKLAALREAAMNDGTPVLIPMFDTYAKPGSNTAYHVVGFAAFVITGYRSTNLNEKSWLSDQHFCTPSESCLYGYFVRAGVPGGGEVGGPDYGANLVYLVG